VVYFECPANADRSHSFIWALVTLIIGRMLLNLRGVSTPDEWENANDANFNAMLHDLPVIIIGNPNRDINSQGEIVENEPTYTEESGGWPENYDMAVSRSEKETCCSEGPGGDAANQEKWQSVGIKTPSEARGGSWIRGHAHGLKAGGALPPIASSSRTAAPTPSSSPRTLVHQPGTVESGKTVMGTLPYPLSATPQLPAVDAGELLSKPKVPRLCSTGLIPLFR